MGDSREREQKQASHVASCHRNVCGHDMATYAHFNLFKSQNDRRTILDSMHVKPAQRAPAERKAFNVRKIQTIGAIALLAVVEVNTG